MTGGVPLSHPLLHQDLDPLVVLVIKMETEALTGTWATEDMMTVIEDKTEIEGLIVTGAMTVTEDMTATGDMTGTGDMTVTGAMTVTEVMTVTGGMTMTGGMTVTGDMAVIKDIVMTGEVMIGTVAVETRDMEMREVAGVSAAVGEEEIGW